MRQRGHSHRHGGDEGPGGPEQQLHCRQEERQAEAKPPAAGGHRRLPHRHAEGELLPAGPSAEGGGEESFSTKKGDRNKVSSNVGLFPSGLPA